MPRWNRHLVGALVAVGGLLAVGCGDGGGGADPGDGGSSTTEPGTGSTVDDGPVRVLFVRGASGTGGFYSAVVNIGETDDLTPFDFELSSIEQATELDDEGNTNGTDHGFAELASLLRDRGHEVSEEVEPGGDDEAGVDLSGDLLADVDVLVLGSNNGTYTDEQVGAVVDWVRGGGSLLVFQDVNYGSDWDDAADSDTQFLEPFGMRATQDNTSESEVTPDQFADHPVVEGVEGFGSLGVAVIELTGEAEGVTPTAVIAGGADEPGIDMANEDEDERRRAPNPDTDAVLAVVEYGAGRVAAFYDRDLFFNSSLEDGNVRRLTEQLFAWLAGEAPGT
jgi:hypothetical protein